MPLPFDGWTCASGPVNVGEQLVKEGSISREGRRNVKEGHQGRKDGYHGRKERRISDIKEERISRKDGKKKGSQHSFASISLDKRQDIEEEANDLKGRIKEGRKKGDERRKVKEGRKEGRR